jgi:hypothetical protein
MSDSNNHLAGKIPSEPYPELKSLEPLIGKWQVTGNFVEGSVTFEWQEGGYFLVQRVDMHHGDQTIRGIEYIGFDEDTRTLRSHYIDNNGSNFTYTWQLKGNMLKIWFGEKGSDNSFTGTFTSDGKSYSGSWQWPGAGYEATLTRTED